MYEYIPEGLGTCCLPGSFSGFTKSGFRLTIPCLLCTGQRLLKRGKLPFIGDSHHFSVCNPFPLLAGESLPVSFCFSLPVDSLKTSVPTGSSGPFVMCSNTRCIRIDLRHARQCTKCPTQTTHLTLPTALWILQLCIIGISFSKMSGLQIFILIPFNSIYLNSEYSEYIQLIFSLDYLLYGGVSVMCNRWGQN